MTTAALIIGFLLGAQPETEDPRHLIKIDMKYVQEASGKRPLLHVTVTNEGSESLEIQRSRLPWGNRYSMILVAVEATPPHPVLAAPLYIDDPVPERIRIDPKQTLEGTIDLEYRFPGITKTLKSQDVVLLWSYQLRRISGEPGERLTGALVIPEATAKPSR